MWLTTFVYWEQSSTIWFQRNASNVLQILKWQRVWFVAIQKQTNIRQQSGYIQLEQSIDLHAVKITLANLLDKIKDRYSIANRAKNAIPIRRED